MTISLFIQQIWVKSKTFFLSFFVDILTLGSGSVDPYIIVDRADPGSADFFLPVLKFFYSQEVARGQFHK